MRRIYETGEYLERNPDWHAGESPWKAAQILRMIEVHGLRPRQVCEIGCGAGEVLRQLQMHMDPTVVFSGYDISPQAIAISQPRANARLTFELGGAESVPDGGFDLALVLDVIEHVDDYMGFLRSIRTKGRLTIFHIPLDLSAQTVLRRFGLLSVRYAFGHLHYFSRETALRTLEDTGYRLIDWFYTRRAIEEPAAELRRRLARLPRRIAYSIHRDVAVRALGGFSLLVLATAAG